MRDDTHNGCEEYRSDHDTDLFLDHSGPEPLVTFRCGCTYFFFFVIINLACYLIIQFEFRLHVSLAFNVDKCRKKYVFNDFMFILRPLY